jgi:RNA polymerase sigma-70 factor (ECF subfamily)
MAATLSIERERELIAQGRSSNKAERNAAFAQILREFGPPLHALCLGVTGNRSDAEDAVQDALYTVAAQLHRFRGEARLYSWCYRIALRAAVRVRAKNRNRRVEPSEPLPAHTGDPMAEREEARRLLAAMAELPIEQRTVLSLFTDGRSHQQIAEILDVPTGTVWSRLHLARKRLREVLNR